MRNLSDGRWVTIDSKETHSRYLDGYRVRHGQYLGAGMYYLRTWLQRCPRGCCDDECVELLHPSDVVVEAKENMADLAGTLRTARSALTIPLPSGTK